jgi:glycosyltransferase involved in cell wall biosynthesis
MVPDIVVMTRDAAAHLPDCLRSLQGVGPVWVVDSFSADNTAAVAAAHGATLVPFRWDGRYPKKKQWSLDMLPFAGDWVLFVDADERLTPALAAELAALPADSENAAYFADLRPRLFSQTLRFGRRHHKAVLLHRRRARYCPCDDLGIAEAWEVEGHYQPQITGTVGRLRAWLVHDLARDAEDLQRLRDRHRRYALWGASLALRGDAGAWASSETRILRRLAKYALRTLPAPGLLAWADSVILKLGFLDGRAGLLYAATRAEYYAELRATLRAGRLDGRKLAQPAE